MLSPEGQVNTSMSTLEPAQRMSRYSVIASGVVVLYLRGVGARNQDICAGFCPQALIAGLSAVVMAASASDGEN